MRSTPSLSSLPGPLGAGVVAPDRVLSMGQIEDADYANDITLLANSHNQAETLLHSLDRAATGIDLIVNAHKTEYMGYNQTGDISSLDGTSLKLVNKFT